jgi:hypothetical protein
MKRIKDLAFVLLILVIGIVIVCGGLLAYDFVKLKINNKNEKVGYSANSNVLDTIIHNSTTTSSYCSYCPVKLLDYDFNRQYARIQNVSDTAVYLYISTTTLSYDTTGILDSQNSATGTISSLNGLIVLAPLNSSVAGDSLANADTYYDILPNNLIIGEIWATSTANGVGKRINVIYK